MNRFLSNYINRLDAKGRVSIPAAFRMVLAKDGFDGLYLHLALDAPALDAGGNLLLNEIDQFLQTLAPYSEERDRLSTALFGTSEILKLDSEGRVVLTETVKDHAGITDSVAFVGLGHKFQIWEPARFREHLAEARAKVRNLKKAFGSKPLAGAAGSCCATSQSS
jgi:MraZ protein